MIDEERSTRVRIMFHLPPLWKWRKPRHMGLIRFHVFFMIGDCKQNRYIFLFFFSVRVKFVSKTFSVTNIRHNSFEAAMGYGAFAMTQYWGSCDSLSSPLSSLGLVLLGSGITFLRHGRQPEVICFPF